MKPTAEETLNLRKKMGEIFGIERADKLWFGFYLKNQKIVEELKKYIETDEGLDARRLLVVSGYPNLQKILEEKLD